MSCQIQKGEQENPDDVDEVPVESGDLDWREMAGRKFSDASEERENQHDENSDCNVNCVETGHGEIEPKENLGMPWIGLMPLEIQSRHQMVGPVLVIFDAFQNHKNDSEKGRTQ